jgi:hypothetical protein
LRAGIIGLDTSHVVEFTKALNDPKAADDLAGVRVVAAFPGGSEIPSSRDRVAKFTEQVKGMGVEIVDSIPAVLDKVDVVLLESVDGRQHLEQARAVFKTGKPTFIDKPLAGSLADALAIAELGETTKTPWFSSSAFCSRYASRARRCEDRGDRGLRRLGYLPSRADASRSLLVRRSWRRDPVYDHGDRLRDRFASTFGGN